MDLTGLMRIWAILTDESDDSIKGGSVVVGDGEQSASAPINDMLFPMEEDGVARLTVSATFGADVGNFDWLQREVRTAQGIVLDAREIDLGRKAAGAEWVLTVDLDLVPLEAAVA